MTIVDPASLEPQALVSQYVLDYKGSGFVLRYRDYEYIDGWLSAAQGDVAKLLSVLEDIFLAEANKGLLTVKKNRFSLSYYNRLVLKKLLQTNWLGT